MNAVRALFIPTLSSGIAFWRMANFWSAGVRTGVLDIRMPFWEKDAHEGSTWQFELGDPERKRAYLGQILRCLREVDVCVMQMATTPPAAAVFEWIRDDIFPHIPVPIVAECDDDYRNTPAYNPAGRAFAHGSKNREMASKQFKKSDAMIVSTPALKDLYSDLNDQVYVIPNAIDFSVWDRAASRRRRKFGLRIGWAGGANHERDLLILKKVVPAVLAKHRQVRFVFVHGVPEFLKRLPGVEVVSKFVPIRQYPNFLASQDLDIGLAPIEDNTFNAGKSNLRWLEYSALGIPTIASRVGHFAQTINDGEDGFLVDTNSADAEAAGFTVAIDRLVTNRSLRLTIGARARDRVRRDFNVDFVIGDYARALSEIKKRGRVPRDERAPAVIGGVLYE